MPRKRASHERNVALNVILLLHDRLAITTMLFMAAVGIWGLASYMRGQTLSGSFAGALIIGEALVTAQVGAGVALYVLGARSGSPIHYLYGVTAILILPFAWSYLRERDQRRALAIYSLIALFIFGLAVRGMITAA